MGLRNVIYFLIGVLWMFLSSVFWICCVVRVLRLMLLGMVVFVCEFFVVVVFVVVGILIGLVVNGGKSWLSLVCICVICLVFS